MRKSLKQEYDIFSFVDKEGGMPIKGWAKQPLIEELENLFSNQEALTRQMTKSFDSDVVLF